MKISPTLNIRKNPAIPKNGWLDGDITRCNIKEEDVSRIVPCDIIIGRRSMRRARSKCLRRCRLRYFGRGWGGGTKWVGRFDAQFDRRQGNPQEPWYGEMRILIGAEIRFSK